MKVKELIAKLQEFDGELKIMICEYTGATAYDIDEDMGINESKKFGKVLMLFPN